MSLHYFIGMNETLTQNRKGNKMKIAHVKDLKFGKQVNYPDLAYNIHAIIYELTAAGKLDAVHGLEVLDLAYRGEGKTYRDFSDKYGKKFRGLLQSSLPK